MNEIPKDPAMLLGFVNLKLRDFYDSLDSMCDDMNIDKDAVIKALYAIGYEYDEENNQFR
ncbi:MAG: DUF4250 domain-containing protein [Lachnospiraceae bacterium]|nr:DUF4250 domain-containing protein [Lachnospiraceae bacterium]